MSRRILIVDDDMDILEAMTVVFEMQGDTVITRRKVTDIVSLVRINRPDIVILDLLISGLNGADLCRKLKSVEITKSIPIVMMSAHPTIAQTSKECGAEHYLKKPFRPDELHDLIESIGKRDC